MIKTWIRVAFRQMRVNKLHSTLNIIGLSVGMAVAMLIGLWIWDELSFDRYHGNYDRIAAVKQFETYNGVIKEGEAIPVPLERALRTAYGGRFEGVAISSMVWKHVLSGGGVEDPGRTAAELQGATAAGKTGRAGASDGVGATAGAGKTDVAGTTDGAAVRMRGTAAEAKSISYPGAFMDVEGPAMFGLDMERGDRGALGDPSSILLSASLAKALFGDADPVGRPLKLDNKGILTVRGVYKDLPLNTTLRDLGFLASWKYFVNSESWVKDASSHWDDESFLLYVQVGEKEDMAKLSSLIRDIKRRQGGPAEEKMKTAVFLHPMSRWHLYGEFRNGVNVGGAIQYVWLFGIIGGFVLLLACINFMNLSTARSEKRAREVGIRKAIGSSRGQLILQFFGESMLMASVAFAVALALVWLSLPFFNSLAGKEVLLPVGNLWFWVVALGFVVLTGVMAGSYPALYLSSFRPVKVLKGVFKAGRLAALPRQALVVLQFTVSVVMIIGTIVVFQQIRYARERPVGYTREGLLNIEPGTNTLHEHFDAFRSELLSSGQVAEVAESSSPVTGVNNNRDDLEWEGKDPSMSYSFANIRVTSQYGKTVGWQFVGGRDFDAAMSTDSQAVVLNETAVKVMGLQHPLGSVVHFGHRDHRVIGVIRDMVMMSPYEPVKQTIFYLSDADLDFIDIRLKPGVAVHAAVGAIGEVYKQYGAGTPFAYQFADENYSRKFAAEERVGRLAGVFAVLAIVISCLGLWGMASFVAEQRVKEIGVRKVLGASVVSLWGLLSRNFVMLVCLSLLIAMPLAWMGMRVWLGHYVYRTAMAWWIFAAAGLGALGITLVTVSWQTIRAARANPVKSLRSE